ncbi:helix-turn-helix domain-containing protein [Burkholderia gladioli]|uniref:helix-turn-helix domain-containing protein n=1 Tax=Burkholderia gladioli TaxID=28095 RepID=UPI0016402836|nr:helix-turn-helix transcriptional regulator [Burkholderia gladioli]
MSTLAERLELALKSADKKPAELARACAVKAPSVSDWLSGKTKKMEGANLLMAADFLNVEPWWLATGEGSMERRPTAPAPSRDRELGQQSRALVEAIARADASGMPTRAFRVLHETLKTFEDLRGVPAHDELDLDAPDQE